MLQYDFYFMILIINSVFKTNSGLPSSYLHVWHLQEKLELKVFWTIILFSTRVNGNLSLAQVWYSQFISVLELISWIPKHFLCVGVWQVLQTKDLPLFLFVFIQTLQILFLIVTLASICWLWVGFVVIYFLQNNQFYNI